MPRVLFHPKASKELLKIPKSVRLLILNKIAELEKLTHPLQHRNVIKLRGRVTEDFRMRIGSYRVKFTSRDPNLVLVTHVQHRQVGY